MYFNLNEDDNYLTWQTANNSVWQAIKNRNISQLNAVLSTWETVPLDSSWGDDNALPIIAAARAGWWEGVLAILQGRTTSYTQPLSTEEVAAYNQLLGLAAYQNAPVHVVQQLLNYCSPQLATEYQGRSKGHAAYPLHWAACNGNVDVVKLLIENRADIAQTFTNEKGQKKTALPGLPH